MTTSSRQHVVYRPEIDGLRALSILAVILYHFDLGLPGGYVGVDIFFVISGYLITGIILKDLEHSRFTVKGFLERRIRRIMPASLGMAVFVLLAGMLILLPEDLGEMAKSCISHCCMLANVFFLRDADYFAAPNDLKPFLHTWSLSVEEQFYVFYPIILAGLFRRSPLLFSRGLIVAGIASFLACVVGVFYFPAATFYLLPTRAWELLLGGALCSTCLTRSNLSRGSGALTIIGLGMMFFSMGCYSKATPFPGAAASIPCLGAALFIAANTTGRSWAARVISVPPMRFIGLISYSLYLWHWPVIAFVRYVFGPDLGMSAKLFVVILSFICATLSWRFIEQPFRNRSRHLPFRSMIVRAVFATSLVLLVACSFWLTKGLASFRSEEFQARLEDVISRGRDYETMEYTGAEPVPVTIGIDDADRNPLFLIWGDSHALALAEIFDDVASSRGIAAKIFARPSLVPVPGVDRWQPTDTFEQTIPEINDHIVNYLLRNPVKKVILVARWSVYVDGFSDSDLMGNSLRDRYGILLRDGMSAEKTPEQSAAVLCRHLKRLMTVLRKSGVERVYIVPEVPEQKLPFPARQWHFFQQLPGLVDFPSHGTTRAEHQAQQARVQAVLEEVDREFDFVSLQPTAEYCFDENGRSILVNNGRCCYRDNDHLSKSGASSLLRPYVEKLIEELSK